jgi:alkylated DNA nucleotide flippase Atl1
MTFADRVLSIVQRIPAGRVATYGDIARLAGRPRAARAVGTVMRTASVTASRTTASSRPVACWAAMAVRNC